MPIKTSIFPALEQTKIIPSIQDLFFFKTYNTNKSKKKNKNNNYKKKLGISQKQEKIVTTGIPVTMN